MAVLTVAALLIMSIPDLSITGESNASVQ